MVGVIAWRLHEFLAQPVAYLWLSTFLYHHLIGTFTLLLRFKVHTVRFAVKLNLMTVVVCLRNQLSVINYLNIIFSG